MVFVGDVAIGAGVNFELSGFPVELRSQSWCVNLEGTVAAAEESCRRCVYNTEDWTSVLNEVSLGPVFLANNHVADLDRGVETTLRHIDSKKIKHFGAGMNRQEAAKPCVVSTSRDGYVLLGYGWDVVGCIPARSQKPGVNHLDAQCVRNSVEKCATKYPEKRIVVVFHWNYEFELFPQPGHRKLAMELIDRGAHAVIGHHPHRVGPIERYHGRTIAYSVGNWAFSYGHFFSGRLRFPESSFDQIAIELGAVDTVHHARFVPPSTIQYISSEPVASDDLSLQAQFEGLSHRDYIDWFRAHRVKRKGLPIYTNADDSLSNTLRNAWVRTRQLGIDLAVRVGVKSTNRNG